MAFVEKKRWLFFGLPLTFTKYTVTEEQITINSGFLTRIENDCYMYKVQDTVLSESIPQRIFGIATIVCKQATLLMDSLFLKTLKMQKQLRTSSSNVPKNSA